MTMAVVAFCSAILLFAAGFHLYWGLGGHIGVGVSLPQREDGSTAMKATAFGATIVGLILALVLLLVFGLVGVIRLPVPQLTEERRKDLVKVVKKEGEEKKVMIRNLRRDSNDKVKVLEKDSKVPEDEAKKGMDDIQKLTDKYIHEIDKLVEQKEKEIMEV